MKKILKNAWNSLTNEGFVAFSERSRRRLVTTYKLLTFRSFRITKSLADEEIKLIIPNLFSVGWYVEHEKWPELVWIKENCLQKGDLVVDCGANIGFTSIFFAKCVGDTGKVIGIEAVPANAQVACKNVHLNNIKNCEIINVAVGAQKGYIKFLAQPNGSVSEQITRQTIQIPVVTLDEVFISEKPTFLKIDVEGYELEVLKGAKEILKSRPKLDIELHCFCFSDRQQALRTIFELIPLTDYQVHLQLEVDGEICPYNSYKHTLDLIGQADVVHLFAIPITK